MILRQQPISYSLRNLKSLEGSCYMPLVNQSFQKLMYIVYLACQKYHVRTRTPYKQACPVNFAIIIANVKSFLIDVRTSRYCPNGRFMIFSY